MSLDFNLSLGNKAKDGKITQDTFKGGIKKEQIKNENLLNIFNAIDDGDGVLDQKEIEKFKEAVIKAAGDENLSDKEAAKLLKSNNIKEAGAEDLYEFLNELNQAGSNIKSSVVQQKGNKKTILITYNDGITELINPDKTKEIQTPDGKKTVKDSKNEVLYEEETDEEGNVTQTYFEKGVKSKSVMKGKGGNPVTTTFFDDNGKPVKTEKQNGVSFEEYAYDDGSDTPKLVKKVENKGIPAKEKTTEYTYNGNEVTETSITNGQKSVVVKNGDKTVSSTVTENGKTTVVTESEKNAGENERIAKEQVKAEAEQIVNDLKEAAKIGKSGRNAGLGTDDELLKKTIASIKSPEVLAEVERQIAEIPGMVYGKRYEADNEHSALETFLASEVSEDEVNDFVRTLISNGALQGEDAVNAKARMAVRLITDGGDGMGTDCDKIKEGIKEIDSPEVLKAVNDLISNHSSGWSLWTKSSSLQDYLKGEMWSSEIKYLDGLMAEQGALKEDSKTDAAYNLLREAVEGAGTNIEYLEKALQTIKSPEDRKALEAKLDEYIKEKGIKKQYEGQSSLQAIMYDECDGFGGVGTDHDEIKKFNEMMIKQGAYTDDEARALRAESAALQAAEGDYDNIAEAVKSIKDKETLDKFNEILNFKKSGSIDKLISDKLSETDALKIKGYMAINQLLPEKEAHETSFKLIQSGDFDTMAIGLSAIRTENAALEIDKKLKENGTSLKEVMAKFNADKAKYADRADMFKLFADFSILGNRDFLNRIASRYKENTDMSDNLYVEGKESIPLTDEQKEEYTSVTGIFEDTLNGAKAQMQKIKDGEGAVSEFVDDMRDRGGLMGKTRRDISERLKYDEESQRLYKLAAEGKLTRVDAQGNIHKVTFEEIFKERQGVDYDKAKIDKVKNQSVDMAALSMVKGEIDETLYKLNQGLNSNDSASLQRGILSSLETLSRLSGQEIDLKALGYEISTVKEGETVEGSFGAKYISKDGKPVSLDELKQLAGQMKSTINTSYASVLGVEIPEGASDKDIEKLLDKSYEDKMESFKELYKEAFGKEAPDEMIDSYVTSQTYGKMAAGAVITIGAAIAAPLTGGASLAGALGVSAGTGAAIAAGIGTAAASLAYNGLEAATDANGWTDNEIANNASRALVDGALTALGFKVGQYADEAAKAGKIIAQLKALGCEVSSDMAASTLAELIQNNGEVSKDGFIQNMIFSLAGNAAGRVFSNVTDKIAALKKTDTEAGTAAPEHTRNSEVHDNADTKGSESAKPANEAEAASHESSDAPETPTKPVETTEPAEAPETPTKPAEAAEPAGVPETQTKPAETTEPSDVEVEVVENIPMSQAEQKQQMVLITQGIEDAKTPRQIGKLQEMLNALPDSQQKKMLQAQLDAKVETLKAQAANNTTKSDNMKYMEEADRLRAENIKKMAESMPEYDVRYFDELADIIEYKPEIGDKLVELATSSKRNLFELYDLMRMADENNIDDILMLSKNKDIKIYYNDNGDIIVNDFASIIETANANPQFKTQLMDVMTNSGRPAYDVYNITGFMTKYPDNADDIAILLKSNLNIKVGYNINGELSTNIDNVMQALKENPDMHDEIIDYMSVQRRAENDTTDPAALLAFHIETLRNFPDMKETVMALSKDANLDAVTVRQYVEKYKNNPEKLNDVLFFAKKGHTEEAINRNIKNIEKYPELRKILMSDTPEYTLIDNNVTATSEEVLEKRFAVRDKVESAASQELETLQKTLGDNFYAKVKWEDIIPENATPAEIKSILEQLNDESKFFARIHVNELKYGKNIQWAHEMNIISQSAQYRIANGDSFEDVLNNIADDYRSYDQATTLGSNGRESDRRLFSGRFRGDLPDVEIAPNVKSHYYTPFDKNKGYSEYYDRFAALADKPRKSPYPDVALTQLKSNEKYGYIMEHPLNETINSGLVHVKERYNELAPLFEKVKNGGTLTSAERAMADDKIAEMYFLLGNIMPWSRGSNGIADIFMRSMYKSLGVDMPALKQGVSLDLEAFSLDMDEYKAKWHTFFEDK